MVQVLLDKPALWLSGNGPENAFAVRIRGALSRNLADFPFPSQCSDDEKKHIEDRIVGVLDNLNLLGSGQYISMYSLSLTERRLLLEREFISETHMRASGQRGVYISNDQTLSIMVNDEDHLRIQVMTPALSIEDAWARLSSLDDLLAVAVDYAFDDRLGYLTSDIGKLGTGLRLDVLLHLPAMAMGSRMMPLEQHVRDQQHVLEAFQGSLTESAGDLFVLRNQRTLGRSEEEIVFHVKHLATDLVEQERRVREAAVGENHRVLEDRVGRALGIARGARLLEYGEALDLLSSLRLGLALGMADGYTYQHLNQLLIGAQRAHIEVRKGQACDDVTLSIERADMFRARFS